jgi:transposase-like protein
MSKLSLPRFQECIPGTSGVLSEIARRIGCSRQTVYAWMNDHPEVARAIEEERQVSLDHAETTLYKAIESGDLSAAKYLLSTRGRDRGFSTRAELAAEIQQQGSVVVYLPDNGRD